MSLVVLKRKSQTKYGKLSSRGDVGFSLNDPRRIESKAGRGRIQMQSPMKGNVYRGHGGNKANFVPIKSQYVNSSPHVRDFSNPKSNTGISVKNHHGSIAVRFKWLNGVYPNYVVKNMNTVTSQEYIRNKASQHETINTNNPISDINCDCKNPDNSKVVDKNFIVPSHGEYLRTTFLNKHCLPPKADKLPSPQPKDKTVLNQGNCN